MWTHTYRTVPTFDWRNETVSEWTIHSCVYLYTVRLHEHERWSERERSFQPHTEYMSTSLLFSCAAESDSRFISNAHNFPHNTTTGICFPFFGHHRLNQAKYIYSIVQVVWIECGQLVISFIWWTFQLNHFRMRKKENENMFLFLRRRRHTLMMMMMIVVNSFTI